VPRLRQVPAAEVTDETTRGAYRSLFGDRDPVAEPGTATGTPGNWWTVFANAPDVLRHAMRGFALYAGDRLELRPDLRELAQARVGWAVGSRFVFSQHCKGARAAGVGEEKVAAIPHWSAASCFDDTERAVLAYTDCLALQAGRVPDGLFAQLRERFSDRAIMELTYVTGMYLMHAVIARALRLAYDDRDEPVVEVPVPEGGAAAVDIGTSIAGES
jgi:alkylhydroperoxidase family enzyme